MSCPGSGSYLQLSRGNQLMLCSPHSLESKGYYKALTLHLTELKQIQLTYLKPIPPKL